MKGGITSLAPFEYPFYPMQKLTVQYEIIIYIPSFQFPKMADHLESEQRSMISGFVFKAKYIGLLTEKEIPSA